MAAMIGSFALVAGGAGLVVSAMSYAAAFRCRRR
jgi:hypothetical protein